MAPKATYTKGLTFADGSEALLHCGTGRAPWPPAMDEPRLSLEVLEPAKDESGTARALCLVVVGPAALLAWPLMLVLQGEVSHSGAGLRTMMQLALLLVQILQRLHQNLR